MNAVTVNATQPDLSSLGLEGVALETPDHMDMGSAAQGMKGATKGIVWKLTRDQIKVLPGFNVRANTLKLQARRVGIADNMVARGWLPERPLGVFVAKDGTIYVKDGHTRLEAYDMAVEQGAQIDHIPAICAASNSLVDMTADLVHSNKSGELEPIEVAVVCKRFAGWGWEPARIATKLGLSLAYVNELLLLLNAPPALVALVEEGTVAASTAVTAIKSLGGTAAADAITEVVKGKKAKAQEVAEAATVKKGKKVEATPVKVVPSDIGQSKAQRALKKASQGNALKPGEVVTRMPTAKEAIKLLKEIYTDPAYTKLAPEVVAQVDFFFGKA